MLERRARLQRALANADDLEPIKRAVDDAAAVGGGLWLSYLFVLFYLAVAAGAVTHTDLFFEEPVKLPFLNIELPLLAFFFLAPILFLVVHAYALAHLVMLTDKAKRFDAVLRDQISDSDVGDKLRRQLSSNIFIQFLGGPEPTNRRERAFRWLLWAIVILTLAVAPVFLLLLFQMRFLPFHNSLIAWVQRGALLLDFGLMWWLWSMVLSTREVDRRVGWASWVWARLGILLGLFAVLFLWTAATFPGELLEDNWPGWRLFPTTNETGQRIEVSFHDWVFNSQVDPDSGRRWLPFSGTLVLTGLNVYDHLKIDEPEKAKRRDYVFFARGRNLRGAILDNSSLQNVDFTRADLQGALLRQAKLQMASLDGAKLQGANLQGAKLQGATLQSAQLQGALLGQAQLQGSLLEYAQLQAASLSNANLQGASLEGAKLQGASLEGAQLQGASLFGANLQGASLGRAGLQGALLENAQLQGATLQEAILQATDLSGSLLWRTNSATPSMFAPAAIKLPDATKAWGPLVWTTSSGDRRPWNDESYNEVRKMLDSLPMNEQRIEALRRIQRLDCANPDPALTPCDSSREPSPEAAVQPSRAAAAWQRSLEDSRVDSATYFKALASVLRAIVCEGLGVSGGMFTGGREQRLLDYAFIDNAPFALRGLMSSSPFESRLAETGPEAPALIKFIIKSEDCSVSASLTEPDKARLLQIERAATKGAGQEPIGRTHPCSRPAA
jgi:uncharacterized protein YjbI with pentapeptide repeats